VIVLQEPFWNGIKLCNVEGIEKGIKEETEKLRLEYN
jgi:hypothetical protein